VFHLDGCPITLLGPSLLEDSFRLLAIKVTRPFWTTLSNVLFGPNPLL